MGFIYHKVNEGGYLEASYNYYTPINDKNFVADAIFPIPFYLVRPRYKDGKWVEGLEKSDESEEVITLKASILKKLKKQSVTKVREWAKLNIESILPLWKQVNLIVEAFSSGNKADLSVVDFFRKESIILEDKINSATTIEEVLLITDTLDNIT